MSREHQFYKDDVALFLVSNEGGKEVLFEVRVLEIVSEFGRTRYLVEPIAGKGQMKVEQLIPKKK